jgi:predicted nucleic acid-binding protein
LIVLDASVAVSWLLDDEDSATSEQAYRRALAGEVLLVPAHWWMEVTNALVTAVRGKRVPAIEAVRQRLAEVAG